MDELISRITQSSGLDPAKAHQAVAAILAFLRKEGPPAEVNQLLDAIPGAAEAAPPVEPTSAGGGFMGMGGGGLMGLAGQLGGLGLGMQDMQNVGRELFAFAREKAGEDVVGQIAGAIPGLGQFV